MTVMGTKRISTQLITILAIGLLGMILIGYFFRIPIWEMITRYYDFFTNREQVRALVNSFGLAAPIAFMAIQVLQVLFAPVPGEVTGFIGGALFGATKGFIYSSVALTLGSWLNFSIGRLFGRHYIRKLIPVDILHRFDGILKQQGIVISFILFLIPGFPKDYLCLFLGLSSIPLKVFILLVAVGRMPGTLMLSLQGALLFNQSYGFFALIFGLCLLVVILGYRYRDRIYHWVDRLNNS